MELSAPEFKRRPTLERTCHLLQLATSNKEYAWAMDYVSLDRAYNDEQTMCKFIAQLIERGCLIDVLNYIIRAEIVNERLSLLREESLGSSILKNLWFHFEGKEYMTTVVSPLVRKICKASKKSLEVDPVRIGETRAKKNLVKILSLTKDFLNAFFASYNAFPDKFDQALATLYKLLTAMEGSRKSHLGLGYSEDALRLLGGFLLLRFICPSVVSPVKFGLVKDKKLTANSQRSLITVSKILQSIANQVEFDQQKDAHMAPANALIQDSMPHMLAFLTNLMMKVDSTSM
eukprot:TRINITY_DN22318_c0_g1_i2.p1 TRINITY_DN22318_c0_g1~~TRINITY_DN22318_c0_g1_i2.p1  ORF type:complete len:325 (+),score=48.57 TRINITY_DN22318_c0_g1_i2:110-976(+)